IRFWLLSGWGCRGRRLSRGRRSPDKPREFWTCPLGLRRRELGRAGRETTDVVVMRFNVETFTFACPLAPIHGLLRVAFSQFRLIQVRVNGRQAAVSNGEIRVKFNRALVKGNRSEILRLRTVQDIAVSEGFQCFQRRRGGLFEGPIEFLNRYERLAEFLPDACSRLAYYIEHLLFAGSLRLFLSERVSSRSVDCIKCDHVLAAQAGNRAREHCLDAVALADFPADGTGDAFFRGTSHELERLLNLLI